MTFVGLKCQCQDLEIGEPVVSLTLSIIFPSDIQFSYVFFSFHINDRWSHDAIKRKSSPHVFS